MAHALLEREGYAMTDLELTRSLRRFLEGIDDPVLLHDGLRDRKVLYRALGGFGHVGDFGLMPRLRTVHVLFDDIRPGIKRYFKAHPEADKRRHHTLVDAEALRWAYIEATGVDR